MGFSALSTAAGVEGDHMSLSDTMGWGREGVTEVPPAVRGSAELASVVLEGSNVELAMEPSVTTGGNTEGRRELVKFEL